MALASAISTHALGAGARLLLMVPGVMTGAACCYGALSLAAGSFRRGRVTLHLNLGAGVAMIGFGIFTGLD